MYKRAAFLGLVLAIALAAWVAWPLPADIAHPRPVASVTLLDRHGLPLRTTRSDDGMRGGWLPIEQIDADVLRAFVAAEDRRFFTHHGVDMRALGRAMRDNIANMQVVSGASTITMQTARLLRDTDRTIPGKIAQALWAIRLEAHLDKDEILERYLNRVPLGQGTVGVPAAASLYFEAPARDLSVGQAAMLAGFARSPARDNLIASQQRARARRATVLDRMVEQGYISASDVRGASAEPTTPPDAASRFLAPHFTTRVLANLKPDATGRVRTTIDLDLQTRLESEVRHTVATLRDRAAAQAAAVVIDNASGDVLAWVGSPDFFADTSGQVDMVTSGRQPGSALKPFLYGLAFDNGFTAAQVLPDVPRTYVTSTGPYTPQNYDRRFRGPVRAREALASSYNVPAIELTERLGAGPLLRTLHDAGFASLSRSAEHYGLGLALGNGDVTLLELANAYRGIANGGVWRPHRTLLDDAPVADSRRIFSATSAALVLDILSDPIARVPGFGTATPLDLPFRAAAKTGTSRHYTDNWAVATTANFTVAVWVGNFSGRPMQRVSGITGAGPLLQRAALEVAKRYPPGQLVSPEGAGLVAMPVCILSGMRATPQCPSTIEWFAPGTEPLQPDTWQVDGRTILPPEYAEWTARGERIGNVELAASSVRAQSARGLWPQAPFTGVSESAMQSGQRILSPRDGDQYVKPAGLDARYATIPLVASNSREVQWSVNGRPFTGTRVQAEQGTHVIRARWPGGAQDSVRIIVQ
jgi:penicillin-binding protein 1C